MPITFPPDDPADGVNPFAQSLVDQRERLLNGEAGLDPNSHRAETMLAELDARIDFYRRLGQLPPDPGPPMADTIAEATLARQYPAGPPSATLRPEHVEFYKSRLDALAALSDAQLDRLAADTIADLSHQVSRASAPHVLRNRTAGPEDQRPVIDGLLDDAEATIAALAGGDEKLAARYRHAIRADRPTLETFASYGQHAAGYAAKRQAYGLHGSAPQPRGSNGQFGRRAG